MTGKGQRPLRIAVFANRLPPLAPDGSIRDGERFGGVQRAAWSLTRALARRGHDVWVFSTGDQEQDHGGWHVRQVPQRGRLALAPLAPGLFRAPGRWLDGADVVVAYMGDPPAPQAAARWSRRWRAPLVVSYHGDPVAGFGSPARRLAVRASERWLAPRVLRRAAVALALSRSAASSSRLLPAVASKVRILPNGVDRPVGVARRGETRQRLGIGREEDVILFVGSLTPIKGVDLLLDAAARLDRGTWLLLVGDGPGRSAYERQAQDLGLARVRFLGFVREATKADLLAAADVLAMPSRSEAFPLTLLEAGLAGLPAVASAIPVLAELVRDGETGLLARPEDPAALAAALRRGLGDAGLRRALGAAAKSWAEAHTWDAVAEQTDAVLRDVVDRGPTA